MKKIIKFTGIFLISLFFDCCVFQAIGQQKQPSYPVIGQPCPDFTLKNVEYFSKSHVNLRSLKGKPVILDFFSRGCTSCFISFPKINELKKEYKDIQFLLLGLVSDEKSYELTRFSYETYKKKYNLDFPIVYDSSIGRNFKIEGVPHIVWIDKNGIVKAVTSEIKEKNLRAFINGESFEFEDHSYNARIKKEKKLNWNTPIEAEEKQDSGNVILQRSLLCTWKPGMTTGTFSSDLIAYLETNTPLQIYAWSARNLYQMAYFGKLSDWMVSDKEFYANYRYLPILELKDSAIFSDNTKFTYSLIVPSKRKPYIQEILQRDLQNFFGYEACVEIRRVPYLRLVSSTLAKKSLKSKHEVPKRLHSFGSVEYINKPISDLINDISYDASLVAKNLPLVDETGIEGNIDLRIEAVMTDWFDIKQALQKIGLDILVGEKEMKCLIIRDPKD